MPSPTKQGVELIKSFEGFRAQAYQNPGDVPTIGYGTTVYSTGQPVKLGQTITEPAALEELTDFVKRRITPALQKIPFYDQMTDPQIAALESFAYNLGPGFYGSPNFNSITAVLKEKNWINMRAAMVKYINPGTIYEAGLRARRNKEADMWESGLNWPGKPAPAPIGMPTTQPATVASSSLPAGYLTAHFTLAELTKSETAARFGLPNTPDAKQQANLKRLCETCLEPLRVRLNQPVIVTSGFRAPDVNAKVGGSSTSAHMYGRAADIHVNGMSNADLMAFIHKMNLPVDQVIEEYGEWVHVGIADMASNPRNEYMTARYSSQGTIYTDVHY